MSPARGNEPTAHPRPTVSALLQEALDTPLERLHINEHGHSGATSPYPLPISSPPLAHIDQNQHPHHHSQTASIAPPVRYTAEPEPIQTSDTMPIIRSGTSSVPKLARLTSKSGPVSGITGALNAAGSAGGPPVQGSSSSQVSSSTSRQRKVPTSPPSRRPSDAHSMREEVTKLRIRSGYAQEHTGNLSVSPVDRANRNRDSLDEVRIGGQPFSSLVASNPFQEETNPFKSLISNNPFQTESRSKGQQNTSRPRMRHRSSSTSRLQTPPRHLQRTISSLLNQKDGTSNLQSQYPPDPKGSSSSLPRSASFASLTFPSYISLPKTKLPTFPSFPNVPKSALGNVRAFSANSTNARDDRSMWKTWWEGSAVLEDGSERDPKAREHAHKHMLDDADKGKTIEEENEIIKRKYDTPKNPIVFCHGLLGWDQLGPKALPALQISHWRGICEVLQENGAEILIAKVPATSSAAQRAEILLTAIEEKFPGREVNLVGHSMGGLDGRYLISKLKPTTFKVISLTTISTPHRGSPFADYFIDNIIGRERLPSWLTVLDTVSFGAAGDGSAFQALTTRSMALFNEQVPDDPNVKYYSWGAAYEPGWFDPLRWSYEIIKALEGENDGLVSVASSKWGEFRGVLIGCSHVDLVGWVNHVRFTMEAWAGRPIAFKPATFYLEIADHLAKQGF